MQRREEAVSFQSMSLPGLTPEQLRTVAAWLAASPFAAAVEPGLWALVGHPSALTHLDRRPLPGLAVRLEDAAMHLTGPADSDALAQAGTLVAETLGSPVHAHRDGRDLGPVDASQLLGTVEPHHSLLDPDALERGVLWQLCVGGVTAPGGYAELSVHSSGEVSVQHLAASGQQRWQGQLDAAQRLAWLEAAAFADLELDDDVSPRPAHRQATLRRFLSTADEDAVAFDLEHPPPALAAVVALGRRWLQTLSRPG